MFAGIVTGAFLHATSGMAMKVVLTKVVVSFLAATGLFGMVSQIAAVPVPVDTTPPVATITYSITGPTNQNVLAIVSFDDPNAIIKNNSSLNTYNFIDNGSFVFEFQDQIGNSATATAIVTWIDKIAPSASVVYTAQVIGDEVYTTAILTEYSEPITITNNSGSNEYLFVTNGEFVFEFVDSVGNTGSTLAQYTGDVVIPPVYDKEKKTACNQGIGNGPEDCDPGKSQPHGSSNDESDYHEQVQINIIESSVEEIVPVEEVIVVKDKKEEIKKFDDRFSGRWKSLLDDVSKKTK